MIDQTELSQFTGSEGYTRLGFPFRNVVLTDGALYVAEHGGESGAFWLMQAIASHLPDVIRKGGPGAVFQVWTLTVRPDKTARLACRLDTGTAVLAQQDFNYVDFEEGEWTFYVAAQDRPSGRLWVVMLPSEY